MDNRFYCSRKTSSKIFMDTLLRWWYIGLYLWSIQRLRLIILVIIILSYVFDWWWYINITREWKWWVGSLGLCWLSLREYDMDTENPSHVKSHWHTQRIVKLHWSGGGPYLSTKRTMEVRESCLYNENMIYQVHVMIYRVHCWLPLTFPKHHGQCACFKSRASKAGN